MRVRTFIFAAVLIAVASADASAQMPRIITYQGILTNADGSTFAGTQATVGWQLLSDSLTIVATGAATVHTVRRGAFTLQIDLTSAPVNFARPLHLVILFDGESFAPVRLTAVPYAFFADSTARAGVALLSQNAERAEVADSSVRAATATFAMSTTTAQRSDSARIATNGVPVGTIISYFGEVTDSIANTGWLVCRGQSTSGYPQLGLLIGPLVPDLRGMFLRGANLGRSDSLADPAVRLGGTPLQKIGSVQTDAFEAHNHTNDPPGPVPVGSYGLVRRSAGGDTSTVASTDSTGSGFQPSVTETPRSIPIQGGSETRPNNIAIHWLIKAW
jgi:hypothetical protein